MKLRRLLRYAIVICLVVAMLSGTTAALTLKTTNEEKWIDRIENLPDYAKDFYTWLEDQAALGINGALADPSKATLVEGAYVYLLQKPETASLNASDYHTPEELEMAIQQMFSQKLNAYVQNMTAAYQCFLRDHPEVFWLNGEFSSLGGGSMSYSSSGGVVNITATITIQGVLKNVEKDIRLPKYRDIAVLSSAISARDSAVATIISGASGSRYEKICYLNDWLTKNNAYNSSANLNGIDGDCRSCISALTGRFGTGGPVCEGYAEAFKVLCDQLGIPCVLVTGYGYNSSGIPEAHMWNKVCMEDGKWYGVDVTWNDPVVNGKELQKVSGHENTTYLLVGSKTYCAPFDFGVSHVPVNNISDGGMQYLNDPVLEEQAYTVPSCAHSYASVVTPVTCTTDGYTTHTCSLCGESYVDNQITAPGHNYSHVVTAPTCTVDGYTTNTCSGCGHSYKSDVIPASHNYDVTVIPPTCIVDGYTRHECSVCGHAYNTDVVTASHKYESVVTDPTCYAVGYTTHTCTVCGDSKKDTYVPSPGHNVVTDPGKDPTCTESGWSMGMHCDRCGEVLTAPIEMAALGHAWSAWKEDKENDACHIRSCGNSGCTATESEQHRYVQSGSSMYKCLDCAKKKAAFWVAVKDNKVSVKLAVIPENLKWVYVATYDKYGHFEKLYPVEVTKTEFEIPLTDYNGKGKVTVFWLNALHAPIRANNTF